MQTFVRSVQIISRLDSQSKFQMFDSIFRPPLSSTEAIPKWRSIVGFANLPKTFGRISEVWENTEILNTEILEKCRLYLSYDMTIS